MPNRFVAFAERLADTAASMIDAHRAQPPAATMKGDKTLVTELDLAIERCLRGMIEQQFPDHGILGEEFEAKNRDAEWVWVLDPIDGTAAFVAGMTVYSTLIALAHCQRPVLGVMHFPATGERWLGVAGQPTRLNGEPCHTRAGESLADAIQSTSSPDFFSAGPELRVLQTLSQQTAWRIYGGAAMSYGRLASGRTDIALDAGLKIHDYAAFVPVIEGAGGVISDWQGQALTLLSGPTILAAGDPRRHAAALVLIDAALQDDGAAPQMSFNRESEI